MRKEIVWLVMSLLMVLSVLLASCAPATVEEAEEASAPPVEEEVAPPEEEEVAPPKSGEWSASTEFGELMFTVNPGGTGITKISFHFSEFKCGPVTLSGAVSVENPSLWAITDGQFTAKVDLMPPEIIIRGEFNETGRHASGTWEVHSAGTICSGTWEARPTGD